MTLIAGVAAFIGCVVTVACCQRSSQISQWEEGERRW